MKPTIENILANKVNLENLDPLKFDWMLFKIIYADKTQKYQLQFSEVSFIPSLFKMVYEFNKNRDPNLLPSETSDDEKKELEKWKCIFRSPCYRKIIDGMKNGIKAWYDSYGIPGNVQVDWYGDSPEAIKNDICFSKILPYLDPTKMEVIDLTK